MFLYFAQPIDQASVDSTVAPFVRGILRKAGAACFVPSGAFTVEHPTSAQSEYIDLLNTIALSSADGLVAYLPAGTPTLGTPVEIEYAVNRNMPVLIVTDIEHSIQLDAWARQGAQVISFPAPGDTSFSRQIATWIAEAEFKPRECQHAGSEPPHTPSPTLQFKRLSTSAKMPTRAYLGDAGLDLACVGEHDIHPGAFKWLPTGVACAVPEGYWGMLCGRSSAWSKWTLDIRLGVIDSGYRGELMVGVHNRGDKTRIIQPGTRLAQYIILPAFVGGLTEVAELEEHERGANGWGSSGA